jgi:hypothetical protein
MSKDLKLQTLLAALNRYIDDMPLEGSEDYAKLSALWTELLAYRPVVPVSRKASAEPPGLSPDPPDRAFGLRIPIDPAAQTSRPPPGSRYARPVQRDR